jgi:hypothetical protein
MLQLLFTSYCSFSFQPFHLLSSREDPRKGQKVDSCHERLKHLGNSDTIFSMVIFQQATDTTTSCTKRGVQHMNVTSIFSLLLNSTYGFYATGLIIGTLGTAHELSVCLLTCGDHVSKSTAVYIKVLLRYFEQFVQHHHLWSEMSFVFRPIVPLVMWVESLCVFKTGVTEVFKCDRENNLWWWENVAIFQRKIVAHPLFDGILGSTFIVRMCIWERPISKIVCSIHLDENADSSLRHNWASLLL